MNYLQTLSDPAIIRKAIEENAVTSTLTWGDWRKMKVVKRHEHILTRTPVGFPFFNCLLKPRYSTKTATIKAIDEHIRWGQRKTRGVSFWLGADYSPKKLPELLESKGCIKVAEPTGMAVLLDELPDLPLLDNTRFTEVISEEQFDTWLQVMAPCHELPDEIIQQWGEMVAAPGYGADSSGWRHFILYQNNEPVGTSSLFIGAGVVSVANIAVMKNSRNQGLGKILTARTYRMGLDNGCQVGTLWASEEGKPVYKALGFREYGVGPVYIRMPR